MKTIGDWIGLVAALLVFAFIVTWFFLPEKKQSMLDWWHAMTIDCQQLHSEISNDENCETSDDCDLSRKESIRAKKAELRYDRYCSVP